MREHLNLTESAETVSGMFNVTEERGSEIFNDVKGTFQSSDDVADVFDKLVDKYPQPNEFGLVCYTVGYFKNEGPSMLKFLEGLLSGEAE